MEWADFVAEWNADADNNPLQTFEPPDAVGFDADTILFLRNAGLPTSAAPFLSFAGPDSRVPGMDEIYGLPDTFGRYRIIGSDGEGSPICIETETDEIYLLDHDLNYEPDFVNSTVSQLGASLLAYRKLVRQTIAARGEDAFLDNDVPTELALAFEDEMLRIDSRSMSDGAFWTKEYTRLTAGRYGS